MARILLDQVPDFTFDNKCPFYRRDYLKEIDSKEKGRCLLTLRKDYVRFDTDIFIDECCIEQVIDENNHKFDVCNCPYCTFSDEAIDKFVETHKKV